MVCSHWYYKARDKFLLTSESAIHRIKGQERGTVLDSAVVVVVYHRIQRSFSDRGM